MDTYKDLTTYQEWRTIVENLVYRTGVWPHREDTGIIYNIVTFYGFLVLSVVGTKTMVYAFMNMSKVRVFVHCLRSVLATFAPMMRMVCCLIYRKEFVFLDKELKKKFEEKLENEKNRPALLKNVSLYSKFLHLYYFSTIMSSLFYFITYGIIVFKYKKSIQLFMGKYPFPVKPRSNIYWAIFAFESSVFWFITSALSGLDNIFGIHCFRICGFLRLAIEQLKAIDPKAENYRDNLRECVSIHQLLIRAKVALEKAYGVIVIWNYIISAIVMCSLLWQADQMKSHISVPKLFFLVFYMAAKLIQVYTYAYYGSTVTTESEHYREAIYTCNWPGSGNLGLMKDLRLTLTQPTITLRACGYFSITMEFFEKICHTSLSYFFLLQSLDTQR